MAVYQVMALPSGHPLIHHPLPLTVSMLLIGEPVTITETA
jgi:hypothetical protein